MKQKIVIIRGAACSGKTTICEQIRDFDKKIAWLSIDKVKPLFSDYKDETLDDVHLSVNAILSDLLNRGFSVVLDGILKKPKYTEDILNIAKSKNIPYVIYQLECSLETLRKRDEARNPRLGDELIESLYRTVQENPIEGAIKINTEEKSLEECVEIIRKNFE